jgi:prepilin-type N-terminal cleavage/methylation domain-containing protein/prepilin-type processing-associated H-X9-DG protein
MRTTRNFHFSARRNWSPAAGFTLVEVMAVIAIVLVVVTLLSAALNQTRIRTMRVLCLDNMKQLQTAWLIYADDHNDYIALNRTAPVVESSGTIAAMANTTNSWVAGNPKLDKSTDNIKKGVLYPIVKHPEVYRCPLDNSKTRYGTMRNRSYSINSYLGGDDDDLDPRVKMKTSELVNPPPDQVFVFIEEHEESVWSGGFLVLPREGGAGTWNSTPTDRHMQGCNLTFADGHLEYWKWLAPKRPNRNQLITDPKDLRDLRRLQESLPKP